MRKPEIVFESPFPGSQAVGYVNDERVTFELLKCSSEVCGCGRTEFWGYPVTESYTRHHVEEAIVIAINEDPYDISLHGREADFLSAVTFGVSSQT